MHQRGDPLWWWGSIYIYIYIYMYVCMYVCKYLQTLLHELDVTQSQFLSGGLNLEFSFSLTGCHTKSKETWNQHPMKQQLFSHLLPISKTIQIRWTRHVGHCFLLFDWLSYQVKRNLEPTSHETTVVQPPTSHL